jgi:hypothetical protein
VDFSRIFSKSSEVRTHASPPYTAHDILSVSMNAPTGVCVGTTFVGATVV